MHGFGTRHTPASLGCPEARLKQIHSDIVRVVEKPIAPEDLRGDALVTSTPGLALTVVTADCLPVLLADPKRRVVAVVHAGWRGTLRRIVEKTVGVMRQRFGVDPANVVAAFGPSIQVCCYEVGEEVVQEFRSQFPYAEKLFQLETGENPADVYLPRQLGVERKAFMRNLETGKAHLNLVEANYRQLLDAGVRPGHIHRAAPCTSCNLDLLCSYRRQGPRSGRLISAIRLCP